MDGRMDEVAKALVRGATRREELRLAGGGLAGALLAAVGLTNQVGAQGAAEGARSSSLASAAFTAWSSTSSTETMRSLETADPTTAPRASSASR